MLSRVLLTTDAVGGVWQYSMELARGLAAIGIELVVAVLGPPPNAAQMKEAQAIPRLRLNVTGLPLEWLADTPNQLESASQALARLAAETRVDTVHLHAPALVGEAIWPAPVIAVAHSCVGTWWDAVHGGPMPADLAWRANATAMGIQRADTLIAPSNAFAAALHARYHTGRDIEVIANARTPARARPRRRQLVLTAGRLWDAGKNIATLDAAASRLSFPIHAAGPVSGPNGALISCRNLQLLGSLDDAALADAYARTSVFVSTSVYEPFGLAVLEAAQAGCALLLSDIPAFRELWDGAAVFVPPLEPGQIAASLQQLTIDPEIAARQGQAAQARAASFDVQRMAAATWDVHERLAARERAAA